MPELFFVMALFGAFCGGLGIGLRYGLKAGERHGRIMGVADLTMDVFKTAMLGVSPRSDESPADYAERVDERVARVAMRHLRSVFLGYAVAAKEEANASPKN